MFSEKTQYLIDTLPDNKVVIDTMWVDYQKNDTTIIMRMITELDIIRTIKSLVENIEKLSKTIIIIDNTFNVKLEPDHSLTNFIKQIRDLIQTHSDKLIVII